MSIIEQQKIDQELRRAIADGNIPAIRRCLMMGAHPGILSDNPFVPGEQRLPAFFWSVMSGNLDMVRKLLEMGFDPSLKDEFGRSALFHVPPGPNGVAIWDALIKAGLDPNEPDKEGGVAWSRYPEKREQADQPARTWKAPRPTLGPVHRDPDEDE